MEKEKTKVLYAISRSYFGGAQRYVHDLITNLPPSYKPIAAVGEGEHLPHMLEKDDIRVHRLFHSRRSVANPFKDCAAIYELYTVLIHENPHVLHLNSSKVGFTGSVAARLYNLRQHVRRVLFQHDAPRCRIIFTAHGWAFMEERPWFERSAYRLLQWWTVLMCHTVICVADIVRTHMLSWPLTRHKLIVIHNGITPPTLKPRTEAREKLLPGHDDAIWIGTVSELVPNKGIDLICEAFSRLIHAFPNALFIVMGEGDERTRLKQLIEQHGISDRVHLLGHIPDASAYLKAFDIFTLTSRKEGFPYTLLEAGHAKLPVIASRVGGIPELIENTVSGILVRPRNVREIESALRYLLEQSDTRATLGTDLPATVSTRFSLEHMVKETQNAYSPDAT